MGQKDNEPAAAVMANLKAMQRQNELLKGQLRVQVARRASEKVRQSPTKLEQVHSTPTPDRSPKVTKAVRKQVQAQAQTGQKSSKRNPRSGPLFVPFEHVGSGRNIQSFLTGKTYAASDLKGFMADHTSAILRNFGMQGGHVTRYVRGDDGKIHDTGGEKSPLDLVYSLYKTSDWQVLAYFNLLSNPFMYPKARIPVTVLTGYIPADLYTCSTFFRGVCNASGDMFAQLSPDGWYGTYYLSASDNTQGKPASCTIGTYAAAVMPSGVQVGCTQIEMPKMSDVFTSNAATGTQYALVCAGMTITADQPNRDSGIYSGRCFSITTLDPERFPIVNQTLDQLRVSAAKQDASIKIVEYHITEGGLFIRTMDIDGSPATDDHPRAIPSILARTIPCTTAAYSWQRIQALGAQVCASPTIGFIVESSPGDSFEIKMVFNYMSEMYPSSLVSTKSARPDVASPVDYLMGVSQELNDGLHGKPNPIMSAMGDKGHGLSGAASWIWNKIQGNPQNVGYIAAGANGALNKVLGTEKEGFLKAAFDKLFGGADKALAPARPLGPGALPEGWSWGEPLLEAGSKVAPSFIEEIAEEASTLYLEAKPIIMELSEALEAGLPLLL